MNFAPFAYLQQVVSAGPPSPLPSGLTIDLWQGNYTANASTWASSVGGFNATMLAGGFGKTTNGVTGLNFTGTTAQTLFTIASSTGAFPNAGGTIVLYMNITSTTNKTLWGKQTANNNGMGTLFSNNPYYFLRTPGSSNEIRTTATTSRGTNVYTFATDGGNDQTCQYYLNKVKPAMTRSATLGTNWNNGYDFLFGRASSWTDPSIQGVLNRLLFFSRKLTDAEVEQVVDYCVANA
jgi:hypothetical protein